MCDDCCNRCGGYWADTFPDPEPSDCMCAGTGSRAVLNTNTWRGKTIYTIYTSSLDQLDYEAM